MKYFYTLGEVFRLKLLLNSFGEPYKHKATISRVASKIGTKTRMTPFGPAKCLTKKQIDSWNGKGKMFSL